MNQTKLYNLTHIFSSTFSWKKPLFPLIFKVSNTIFFPAVSFPILFFQKCTKAMCLSAVTRASFVVLKDPSLCFFVYCWNLSSLVTSCYVTKSYPYSTGQNNQRDEASHTKDFQDVELISVSAIASKCVQD